MQKKMLDIQRKYIAYVEGLKHEIGSLKLSPEVVTNLQFNEILQALHEKELTIPVIGAFSAGKSTLINSFIGQSYLPVAITPETSLATELVFSEIEYIEAYRMNGEVEKHPLSAINTLKTQAFNYRYIKVFLASKNLQSIWPLVLVDMPGFDSPLDLHNQAIIEYIGRGTMYIVLTSVGDGNITRSMLRQLIDIQNLGRDFAFFLSKANLKAPSDVKLIGEKIETQLRDHLGIDKPVVPIGNQAGENLLTILRELNPENLFELSFNEILRQNLEQVKNVLQTASLALQKTSSENEDAIQQLARELIRIKKQKETLLAEAKIKYSDWQAEKIVANVTNDLVNALDDITEAALKGEQQFEQEIMQLLKQSLIVHMQNELAGVGSDVISSLSGSLKGINALLSSFSMSDDFLGSITENVRKLFDLANNIGTFASLLKNVDKIGKVYKGFKTVLNLTTTAIAPILRIAITFLPDIAKFLFGKYFKNRQKDKIRNSIATDTIPSIERELSKKVPEIFHEQVQQIVEGISDKFEMILAEKQNLIEAAEAKKAENEAEIMRALQLYAQVTQKIENLAQQIL